MYTRESSHSTASLDPSGLNPTAATQSGPWASYDVGQCTMTFYEILGVETTASTEEIETAFRVVARRYHPDLNRGPDADERMKEINRIRATLIDPRLRADYDQLLGIQTRVATPSMLGSGSASVGAAGMKVSGIRPSSRSGRLPWGLLCGVLLAGLWGPMLRSDPPLGRSAFSIVTGFLVGTLTVMVRSSGAPVLGGVVIGLIVGAPYAFANHLHSSLLGGAICGGLVAWAIGLVERAWG